MRKLLLAAALPVAVLALVARADTPDPKAALDAKLMEEIKERSKLMANLTYLSDRIGPRLTGSPGLEAANKWTKEKMEEYGLTNVKLEPWEIPVGWRRGTAKMTLVSPTVKPLTVASAGWSPGTAGPISGKVVVMNAKTKADLEQYKGKLKNAIVIRTPPTNVAPVAGADPRYGEPGGRRGISERMAGGRDAVPSKDKDAKKDTPTGKEKEKDAGKEKAKEKDAPPRRGEGEFRRPPSGEEFLAFQRELTAFMKAEGVAATLRDSGKPHGLLVTTGGWPTGDRGTDRTGPASLFMAHEDYALLYRLVTESKVEPTVELEVTNTFIEGPVTVYNTVGEIRGSEKPDEFVVVGAHLDSWDLAQGTTDNGTGSCVVLETARAISAMAKAGSPPKRTIRFVLFTGEEQGLHGSKQYVIRHKDELAKTSMAIVHDTGTGRVYGLGLQGREAVRTVLAPELTSLKAIGFEGLTLDRMGGTDHLSFESAGVPGFACKQDSDEYRFTHHTQSDTLDKAKPANLIQGAQVMAVTALRAANLPDLLPRTDRTESRSRPVPAKDETKKSDPDKK